MWETCKLFSTFGTVAQGNMFIALHSNLYSVKTENRIDYSCFDNTSLFQSKSMSRTCLIYTRHTRYAYSRFFLFFGVRWSMFQVIHLYSSVAHQFMLENSVDSVLIGVSNQSWNKGGIPIECHKYFNMKYGRHPREDMRIRQKKETHTVRFPVKCTNNRQ